MTKPENFLKFSSLLNLVLSNITRSQVLVWVGPAWRANRYHDDDDEKVTAA